MQRLFSRPTGYHNNHQLSAPDVQVQLCQIWGNVIVNLVWTGININDIFPLCIKTAVYVSTQIEHLDSALDSALDSWVFQNTNNIYEHKIHYENSEFRWFRSSVSLEVETVTYVSSLCYFSLKPFLREYWLQRILSSEKSAICLVQLQVMRKLAVRETVRTQLPMNLLLMCTCWAVLYFLLIYDYSRNSLINNLN